MLILSDIDGVIANPCEFVKLYLSGAPRNWKDYFKCTLDMPSIPEMVEVFNCLTAGGYNTLKFMTGRPESNRVLTLQYLNMHLVTYVDVSDLLMRSDKDHRPTAQIKLEWCTLQRPELVFEDEPAAVELLRKHGFTVAQVHGYRITESDHIPS